MKGPHSFPLSFGWWTVGTVLIGLGDMLGHSEDFDYHIDCVHVKQPFIRLPMSKLFEQLGGQDDESKNIPLECYEFLFAKTPDEQEQLFKILMEIDNYRSK